MKEFQTVVQELLHNRERQRRYVAFLTALCMLMAFTVSIILIEPAESMTGELACGMSEHIHNENCFTYTCGLEDDTNHVHSAECRKLSCGKTEHAHSENCYIHEDEQTAQIMQINSPQFIDNGMPEGDSPSGDGAQPKAAVDEKTSFESAPADESELPENALEIQGNQITISDLKIDGEEVKGDNNQYHYSTDKDKASVEFNLKYHIDSVTGFSGYLYYQLPEGMVPDNGFYGPDRVVLGDDDKEIGHFAINENGFVSIRFTQDFIDDVNEGTYIDGFVNFKGSVSRNNTADGNRDLHIGKDDIIIDFPDKSFSVTKSGQAVVPETVGGKPKVKWTITVHDLAKADNTNVLSDYILQDERLAGKSIDDLTITPEGAVTGLDANGNITFKNNLEGDVTISFEKELTEDEYANFVAGNATTDNKATLVDKENKTVSEDEATVTFENKVTMQKAGTADYVGEYIQWTVDVSRSLNQSLKDYQVQDDAIKVSDDIIVTSGDRTLTEGASNDYTLDKEKGTITFNKDFADVKITYKQKRDTFKGELNKENASGSIDNVANLIPPAGKPTTDPAKGNVSWNEPLKLTKSGDYDRFNDKINWEIKISSGSNKYSLNNYTITDEALKNVDLSKVNVKDIVYGYNNNYGFEILKQTETEIVIGKHESHWEDGKNITEEVPYFKITKEDTTLKFEEIENYDGPRELVLYYSTPVTQQMKEDAIAAGATEADKNVTNSVTDSKGHEVSKEVGIEPESTVTKVLNGENSKIEYDKNTNTETLHWQVDLTQDLGFDNQEFTDVMIVADNNELSHYITKDQRGKILIQYEKSDGSFTDLPTDDYKITFYKSKDVEAGENENATEFKITFKEGTDVSTYRHIRITYETTADITALTKYKESVTFKNSATFSEKTADSTYTIERRNPDDVPTHTLKVGKSWAANIDADKRTPIQFYLQRTLNNTDWATYNVKEKRWDNNVETFSDDYLTTLNAPNWETTFADLEEHEMGKPENKYTYRVTEVLTNEQKEIFESNVTNNDFKLTGDGKITIENSKKPDFEKIVDIEGAEDGKISVDKLLSDDEYYYIPYKIIPSDFPESTRILIKDIIPDGFELAYVDGGEDWTNPEYDINKHHPYAQKNSNSSNRAYMMFDSNVSEGGTNNQGRHFNYFSENEGDKDVKVALFCVDSDEQVWYQIKIKKSDLKEKLSGKNEFTITNTATVGEKTKPVTVTITGEVEQTAPEDETLLKKDVLRPEGSTQEYIKSNNGVIEYYVYVNPEGKKLSNTDSFDVVDDFTLNSMTSGSVTYTAEQLREMLETGLAEITVEEISDFKQDSDGNITCTTGRKIDNFTYTVEENPNTKTKQDITKTFNLDIGRAFDFDVKNLEIGDQILIELDNAESISDCFGRLHYSWKDENSAWDGSNAPVLDVKKENNKYVAKLTVPEGAKGFWIANYNNPVPTAAFSGKITLKDKVITTYESSSRLTVTVPDETPLKITYRYEVTQDGNTMNTDTRFNASNKVSIATENASSSDELRDVTFRVNQAGAGATTGGNPSIRKFNVGTNKEVSGAKFYIAKYDDDGKWHFVNSVTPKTDEKGKVSNAFTYSETGITDESLPAEAAYIELSGTDKYELTGGSLESGTLYKIIEVKAPSGYQGEGDGTLFGEGKGYASLEALLKAYLADPTSITDSSEYYNLVQRFVAVHYFKYNTTASASKDIPKPANFKGNIMDVKSGGTISIPNNELIDIKATKTWVGSEGTSVTFELLWSTKKQSSGIPDDATPVTASALGLIGEFENEKTISGNQIATWENLPNGLNDRPVYYYVREKSYTTSDGKVYDRQDDGTYKDSEGNEGKYKPTYTGNGLNRDGTVSVTNSNGLVIQKTWLKSNKVEMTEGEIPADKIKCRVYGKTSATAEKTFIEEITLTANDGWKYEPIGDELSKYSQYDYIIIEETEVHLTKDSTVPDKWTSVDVALYGYVRSSTSNVTDGVGTATLINRDNTPTDVDVSVEKVWSDGNDKHSESIEVTLYSSTKSYTDAELGNLNISELPEDLTEVSPVKSGETNPTTLSSSSWTYTWNDLPYKSETGQRYYYYVLETTGVSDYTASYFVNGNKTTITNSVPGSLTIDKKWLSADGTEITNTTDKVDFKLYRRANSSAAADEDKKLDNLKIYAFGDSITYGADLADLTNERYSALLQEKLKANGTNITVDNSSQSGLRISKNDAGGGVEGYIESSSLNDSYDVVIVMAGTNNVLNTNDDIATMKTKMESLLNTIYTKSKNENLVVFVEKIPKLLCIEGYPVNSPTDGGRPNYNSYDGKPIQELQNLWDDLVKEYNEMLDKLAEDYQTEHSERKIIVVDTYTAVGDNLIMKEAATMGSGIHPDKVGHEAIAELLYKEILSYYGIKGSKAPTDIKGLPSDFYKDGSVNPLYEEVTGKEFTLSSEKGWTETIKDLDKKDENGNDYVYYIVEETTGKNWTAAYNGNGQIINDSGAKITVTNTIDKGSIDVEKVWKNANGSDYTPNAGDTVEVQLYRSTTPPTNSKLRTSSIMNEPMALALDDDSEYDTVTVTEGLKANDSYMLLTELGVSNKNIVKVKFEFTGTVKYGIQIGLTSIEGWSEDSKWIYCTDDVNSYVSNEFPSDFNYITVQHNSSGAVLKSVTFYYPKGTLGGTTPEPNPPTQTHGDTELTFESGDGTTKIAPITGANIGDKIVVHLAKDAITVGAKGSFGYSIDDSEHDNWCNYTWNYNNNVISGIATVSIDIDSQVAIGTDGDDITFIWTVPDDYKTNGTIEFQIWKNYNESNLSSATYTIQNSTTTEPVDPEPTDSHIPEGAIKVDEYILKSTDNWKHTFDNLPLTDEYNNPYYYYVKEVNVPNGFEVTYSDGVEPGEKITITNTKKESSTTTMPSTGGNGAGKCYTVGGMLLLMSACGWAMHRRKRVIPH